MITLDGENSLIILDTETDYTDKQVYDACIDWSVLSGNMKYLLPMDFVSPNYRLLNGWKLSASGFADGVLITISGSITSMIGGRVTSGQCVEWDIGTTINTVFIPIGSGLSTEEHDKLFSIPAATENATAVMGFLS